MIPALAAPLLACHAHPSSPQETGETAAPPDSGPPALTWSFGTPEREFTGGYADASPLAFGDTTWLYANRSVAPEDGTLAFTAEDAITWVPASDLLFPGVSTGRAVAVNQGVRFYYPAPEPAADGTRGDPDAPRQIYSAFSADGTDFTDDAGACISATDGDPGGPAVVQIGDRWRMLYDVHTTAEDGLVSGEIRAAWSEDGLSWTSDDASAIVAEDAVEGTDPVAQVLHPFLMATPTTANADGWLLFYNSNTAVYAAWSADGEAWTKLGAVGLTGADFSALIMSDGGLRAWYGTYSDETSGEIWTATLAIAPR